MQRITLLIALLCIAGCVPQSDSPSPRAVFVVSSTDYTQEKLLASLDAAFQPRIDKTLETIEWSDGRKTPRFSHFEIAYWYPYQDSDLYGVALVKWASRLTGQGTEEMRDRYFIDVYAEDGPCTLCSITRKALLAQEIAFRAPCEDPQSSTSYEKVRCGT